MEQLNDHGAFDWIAHGCDRDGFAVSRLVPPLFSAYRKILHPILRDLSIADRLLSWDQAGGATGSVGRIAPDSTAEEILREEIIRDLVAGGTLARGAPGGPFPSMRILWRELAAQYAVDFTPQITDDSFTRVFPGRSWPRYLAGPDEGTLDEESCRRLVDILTPYAETQRCFFYYDLVATRSLEALLYAGRLDEVLSTRSTAHTATPGYWWPEDRTWCVCTDWDLTYTIVGGRSDLALAIDNDAVLESVKLSRRAPYGRHR